MQSSRPIQSSDTRAPERGEDKERRQRQTTVEEVDSFRLMMDARRQRDGAMELPKGAGFSSPDDMPGSGLGLASPESITLSALMAQQTMHSIIQAPQQVAEIAAPQVALADLLERHVRRMLASESASSQGDASIRLSMSDNTLPATELTLERHSEGWRLIANVGSRDSFDMVNSFAPELIKRFAERQLGELQIEPVFEPEIG